MKNERVRLARHAAGYNVPCEWQRARWGLPRIQQHSEEATKMLLEYIQAGLRHAKYEILRDDGTYYREIPECNGVYGNADTLEECREQLQAVLEDWVLLRVHRNLPIPAIV